MRKFNQGKQSELLMNEKLYKQFKILEHFLDTPDNGNQPLGDFINSLWLDKADSNTLKVYENDDTWHPLFENKFKMITEILYNEKPTNPVKGQLWINKDVLVYFNGYEWRPIKALNIDDENMLLYLKNFILMYPLVSEHNAVENKNCYNTIVPNSHLDRIFNKGILLNPHENEEQRDYKILNDVNVEINKSYEQLSAIHLNPENIYDIKRKIFSCYKTDYDNDNVFIPIISNTEFYGFKNGFGKLLVHNIDYERQNGGVLIKHAKSKYDFIYTITYLFMRSRYTGHIYRDTFFSSENKNSTIYIGHIENPTDICVFINGLLLSSSDYKYKEDKYIELNGCYNDYDVTIIVFPGKVENTIKEKLINPKTNTKCGVIKTYKKEFNKPCIFVKNILTNDITLANYDETIENDKKIYYIKDSNINDEYIMFETKNEFNNNDIKIINGTIDNNLNIEYTKNINDNNNYIFIQGLLVSEDDIIERTNQSLKVLGTSKGQEYNIISDSNDRKIFEGKIYGLTKMFNDIDDALIYKNGYLLINDEPLKTTNDSEGEEGEIKYFILDEKWKQYKDKKWIDLEQSYEQKVMDSFSAYSINENSISLLEDITEPSSYVYYGFKFSSNNKKSIYIGNGIYENNYLCHSNKGNLHFHKYKILYKHNYKVNSNALCLWINGYRQYFNPNLLNEYCLQNENYNTLNSFELNKKEFISPIKSQNIIYTIENPSENEYKTYDRIILTAKDKSKTYQNAFYTQKTISEGYIRVFINGIRQSRNNYRIMNPNTIAFKNNIIDIYDDENICILIEIKPDLEIQEYEIFPNTVMLDEIILHSDRNKKFYEDSFSVPDSLFSTRNPKEIMFYINGLYFKSNYFINKNKKEIRLYLNFLDKLRKHKDLEYIIKSSQNKINSIIIEWR